MIVKTIAGKTVSLVGNDKVYLYDSNGVKWERYPKMDSMDPFSLAFRETKENGSVICLTREEANRIRGGTNAMTDPTTIEEMREYISGLSQRRHDIANQWSDQTLQEIINVAKEKHQNSATALDHRINAVIDSEEVIKKVEETKKAEVNEKAPGEAPETHSTSRKYKSTSKRKTQEECLSVATGDISVTLTPKQLEFMERLSECPGWEVKGTEGEYAAPQYAEELSDSMNSMSVGAVLTTLREKGLLATKKVRVGGIKCCAFKLTETGVKVYNKLAHIEESEK